VQRRAQVDRRVRPAKGAGDRRAVNRRAEDRRIGERRATTDRRNAGAAGM